MTSCRRHWLLVRSLRARRVLLRHYVTLISGIVLGVLGALALTSEGFEPRQATRVQGSNGDAGRDPVALATPPAPTAVVSREPTVALPRPRALVFLVKDDEQARAVAQTHSTLVWDRDPLDPYYNLRTPRVHCLIAGTAEEEEDAIRYLNAFITLASVEHIDIRVVDLRMQEGALQTTGFHDRIGPTTFERP